VQLHTLDPQQLLADARDLVDLVEPDRHLQAEALALACHLNHPVYDCLYLALPGGKRRSSWCGLNPHGQSRSGGGAGSRRLSAGRSPGAASPASGHGLACIHKQNSSLRIVQPAQISSSSSTSPGNNAPPSRRMAASRRCGAGSSFSPSIFQISTARCSGNSSQPSWAPLAR